MCRPILSLINDLNGSLRLGWHPFDKGDLLRDRRGIAENQSAITARSVADTISRTASGLYPNKVIPKVLQLLLDAAAARVPNRDHADERANSDRDPKYRKNTSDPIASQRSGCFPDDVLKVHQRCLSRNDPDKDTQRNTS